nr:S-layer homology domain-containing protein [Paenibacillus phyllosphaerae]
MNTDVTVSGLKDASAIADKGAAAIVLRLGLLSPIDGKFMPEAPVTKAQAATVMMRLVRLQGKLDASIM